MNAEIPNPARSFSEQSLLRRIVGSVGPGLVTACVVIGPGSVYTASRAGATIGFPAMIVVVIAALLMNVYMTMGARLGVVTQQSASSLIAGSLGRAVAVVIGVCAFIIATIFQVGNNLAVQSAFDVLLNPAPPGDGAAPSTLDHSSLVTGAEIAVVAFNALAILFLFAFQNFYKALERVMAMFVAVLLLSFAVNFVFGLIYHEPAPSPRSANWLDLSLFGLVGTTFIALAAFYQSYLVRFRGWTLEDLSKGLIDARVSSAIMGLITLMVMGTAAMALRGSTLDGPRAYADALLLAFGDAGRYVFLIGLICAAYSSFLVNSMIGGFLLADSLRQGDRPTDLLPRLWTTLTLVIGGVASIVLTRAGVSPSGAIIAAQAIAVLLSPLVAGVLWWLTASRRVMGDLRNSLPLNIGAGIGFVVVLGISVYLIQSRILPAISGGT